MNIEKRLQKLEEPFKPVSIFADWCIERNSDWNGTDAEAFDQWIDFQKNATPEQRQDEQLNPYVGSIADGLHSNRF